MCRSVGGQLGGRRSVTGTVRDLLYLCDGSVVTQRTRNKLLISLLEVKTITPSLSSRPSSPPHSLPTPSPSRRTTSEPFCSSSGHLNTPSATIPSPFYPTYTLPRNTRTPNRSRLNTHLLHTPFWPAYTDILQPSESQLQHRQPTALP